MTFVARRIYPTETPPGCEDQASARREPTRALAPRFAFGIRRLGDAVVVTLHGELVGPAVTQLEDVLKDLLCGQGNLHLVVDLRELSGIDPTAPAVLAAAAGWARRFGGVVQLYEVPSPGVEVEGNEELALERVSCP